MPRKYKIHDFDPTKPGLEPPKKAPKSQLWEVKAFPLSRAGNSGPNGFPKPTSQWPPFDKDPKPVSGNAGNFQLWVNHYVETVGYYVSILNGLQFDLEKHGGAKNILKEFAEKIDEFAKALHIFTANEIPATNPDPHGPGKPNDPKDPLVDYLPNPKELVWPLYGRYYFRYHFRRIENLVEQFRYFADLELRFECDPLTYLCTNCVLTLRVSDTQPMIAAAGMTVEDPDYISSSSSYVATSSSSSG